MHLNDYILFWSILGTMLYNNYLHTLCIWLEIRGHWGGFKGPIGAIRVPKGEHQDPRVH